MTGLTVLLDLPPVSPTAVGLGLLALPEEPAERHAVA